MSNRTISRLRPQQLNFGNKVARSLWRVVWLLFYRPTPKLLHPWRRLLLRLFGARLGIKVDIYPSSRIWAPWNLEMDDYATLADGVDCYCVDKIRIGANTTISQYTYLCTATHDYRKKSFPLTTAPITIGHSVWIAADVFVAPGVTVGDGAVVLARSTVLSNIPVWTVASGYPATAVKARVLE